MKRRLIIAFFAVVLAFGALATIGRFVTPSRFGEWTQADAFPPLPSLADCAPADAAQRRALEFAIGTLEYAARDMELLPLKIGAEKILARGFYRRTGRDAILACPPDGLYDRVAKVFADPEVISGRWEEYQLQLAARLADPPDAVIAAVGKSAFNSAPQESEYRPRQDIRPLARAVLAGFGTRAADFADQAFQEMSSRDSLGTGAAQVAAATRPGEALPRVEALMTGILASVPPGETVPWHTKNRLYELAYAIMASGPQGAAHDGPLKTLMGREVESFAPPFGMLSLQPKRMCKVLARIEGNVALVPYTYCLDSAVPMDA